MSEPVHFLLRHGYAVVFLWVFAEQIGLPIPSAPLLLAAGALAGRGRLSLSVAVGLAIIAALGSDAIWYELGRRRGIKVLQTLCRISLEPDSCVRRTENTFARHGARSLLVAKFVPGLNTAAPPLAGIVRMRPSRFLLFDFLGAGLWVSVLVGLGYLFSDRLERVADRALALGTGLVALLLGSLGGYLIWKFFKRRRFMRELRIARITPEELKRRLDAGDEVVIVDLRHSLDFEAEPQTIPGAHHLQASELEEMQGGIPADREVVLYCS
jgi:membrane protein DedA with SNARE-associated domain